MPIIKMYREGAVAVVDSSHLPTYENFLEHGWTEENPAETYPPALEVEEAEKPVAPLPKTRKAR